MHLLDWGLRNIPSAGGPSFAQTAQTAPERQAYLVKLIRERIHVSPATVMQGPAEGPGDETSGWMTASHSCGGL